ncbi:redoxin domain-containing protein [Streptomyces sp. NBC_01549]|uniref:redoxin domain-containing protein n=1 Tax=unclassified Streptomyces TaxID=2593676 RepID=UPI002253541F|nr:redoxin domain-containing protein [Streptomyces sp. NBC_01549]MCX4597652.1 redoxin domain-containing protein [Streptomyces sp. NBC_01549]
MPVVIAALVFVGALCVLNLVLSFGMIKRLRDQAEILNRNGRSNPAVSVGMGDEIGEFTTLTEDAEPVDDNSLRHGDTLVAFFSPTCRPCQEKLPKFVDFAASFPGGREKVLATVVGEPEAVADMLERLRPVARVVHESSNAGAVSSAFALKAFPALLVVSPSSEHGRPIVTAEEIDLDVPVQAR